MKPSLWISLCLAMSLLLGSVPQGSEYTPSTTGGAQTVQVPILMYHNLAETGDGSETIGIDLFEAQLQALQEAGYTAISFDTLLDFVYAGGTLPEKPVLLTFDDGYLSNYTLAWPLLQRYGMPATIFCIGISMGRDTYKDTGLPITPHFPAQQAAEMVASGLISVQSHTYDMHQWAAFEPAGQAVRQNILPLPGESAADYTAALVFDFLQSSVQLEAATGKRVQALAYPGGAWCEQSEQILTQLGVRVTLTTRSGLNLVTQGEPDCLHRMLRLDMNDSVTPGALLALLEGNSG